MYQTREIIISYITVLLYEEWKNMAFQLYSKNYSPLFTDCIIAIQLINGLLINMNSSFSMNINIKQAGNN